MSFSHLAQTHHQYQSTLCSLAIFRHDEVSVSSGTPCARSSGCGRHYQESVQVLHWTRQVLNSEGWNQFIRPILQLKVVQTKIVTPPTTITPKAFTLKTTLVSLQTTTTSLPRITDTFTSTMLEVTTQISTLILPTGKLLSF